MDQSQREREAEATRREVLRAAGAAASWLAAGAPGFALGAASADAATPAALEFFTAAQFASVAAICQRLIPATETPGAVEAGVPQYLDRALAAEEPKAQQKFVRGLRWLERRARQRFRGDLRAATPEQQVALLREISDQHTQLPKSLAIGGEFFADVKRRTIFGYYTSLEGRTQELGLPDAVTTGVFEGCRHPEDTRDHD